MAWSRTTALEVLRNLLVRSRNKTDSNRKLGKRISRSLGGASVARLSRLRWHKATGPWPSSTWPSSGRTKRRWPTGPNLWVRRRPTLVEIRRGDIFFANLNPVIGSEQGGTRPVLILQNDIGNRYSPTTIVAAVTSQIKKAKLPTHVELPKEVRSEERRVGKKRRSPCALQFETQ